MCTLVWTPKTLPRASTVLRILGDNHIAPARWKYDGAVVSTSNKAACGGVARDQRVTWRCTGPGLLGSGLCCHMCGIYFKQCDQVFGGRSSAFSSLPASYRQHQVSPQSWDSCHLDSCLLQSPTRWQMVSLDMVSHLMVGLAFGMFLWISFLFLC